MSKIAVGVVGCGTMGKSLAKALAANPDAEIKWACDPTEASARELAEQSGGQVTASFDEVLADADCPAVVLATPHHLHHEPCIRASRAGKHVFCEKPMALSSAHCQEMIDEAAKAGKTLMVGQVLRFVEPFHTLRELATSGTYGAPKAAVVWRSGAKWGQRQDWRMQGSTHGGVLFEVGPHEYDLIMNILGPVTQVHAMGGQFAERNHDVEDLTLVNCRFRDGGSAHFQHGMGDPEGKAMMKVWCEKAQLCCEWKSPPEVRVNWLDRDAKETVPAKFNLKHVQHEIDLWVDSLVTGKPAPIPGEEGMRVVRVLEAAKQSMLTGQTVDIG